MLEAARLQIPFVTGAQEHLSDTGHANVAFLSSLGIEVSHSLFLSLSLTFSKGIIRLGLERRRKLSTLANRINRYSKYLVLVSIVDSELLVLVASVLSN